MMNNSYQIDCDVHSQQLDFQLGANRNEHANEVCNNAENSSAKRIINQWYKKASVKNTARCVLDQNIKQQFFPTARQPLVIHPLVMDKGEEAIQFLLTQSAYRYLHDIAMIETECVNQVALNIANSRLFPVTVEVRQQALSIIVDEAYHAYVALDAIQQIEEYTGIKPINIPHENPIDSALQNRPDTGNRMIDQFVAVCLSEHVLTKDLVYIKQDQNCDFFNQIMSDHLGDEGMHAHFFAGLLQHYYTLIDEPTRHQLSLFIPHFIHTYIDLDFQKIYDHALLSALMFSESAIMEIIDDTYYGQTPANNPAAISFISVLTRTGLLTDNNLLRQELIKGRFL